MPSSALGLSTFAAQNSAIQNDGSADSPRGWAISSVDYTFTATGPSRVRVTASGVNRSAKLASTGIKSGYIAEVVCNASGGGSVNILSSDNDVIESVAGKGFCRLVALQDDPMDATHWEVVDVYEVGSYTPSWISTGTQPSLGNGTLTGNWERRGKVVNVNIKLTYGSTTTSGTGIFSFTVPLAVSVPLNSVGQSLDSGVAFYNAISSVGAWAANSVSLVTAADGANVTGTTPFTFSTNDVIYAQAYYKIA
jgi:hypothetical protein